MIHSFIEGMRPAAGWKPCSNGFLWNASWLDGYLDDAFRPLAEDFIRLLDFIEREGMRQQWREIDATVPDYFHQTPHPLLTAGAERCDDAIITKPRRECFIRNL